MLSAWRARCRIRTGHWLAHPAGGGVRRRHDGDRGDTHHRPNGFFVFKEGYEYVLMVGVVCAAIGLLGPGALSVDRLLGIDVGGLVGLVIVVGLGVLGAAVLLAATWRPARSMRN